MSVSEFACTRVNGYQRLLPGNRALLLLPKWLVAHLSTEFEGRGYA